MNRNTGKIKTFTTDAVPVQVMGVKFGIIASDDAVVVRDFVVTVKNADYDILSKSGQDIVDTFVLANVVTQHVTRFYIKGYFSTAKFPG